MATTNPLEDFLSSDVDENEINALVGSLESQLASPIPKESHHQVSSTSVIANHVGGGSVTGGLVHGSLGSSPGLHNAKPQVLAANTQHVLNTANGPKQHIESPQLIGVNSVNPPHTSIQPNSITFQSTVDRSTPNSHNISVDALSSDVKPNISVIATATPTVTLQSIKSENPSNNTPGATINTVPRVNGGSVQNINGQMQPGACVSSASAIHDLASVAAEQKPLAVPVGGAQIKLTNAQNPGVRTLTVREQLDKKQIGNVQMVNAISSSKPQVRNIIKPEMGVVKHQVKQEVGASQPQVLNVVNAAKTSASTPVSTSVITITKQMANPQTVTVVKPSGPSVTSVQQGQQIQVINVSTPSRTGGAPGQQKLAPRVVNQPVRMPQQAPVRPGSVSMPGGISLPPGYVIMKNESGQIILVQGQQGNTNIMPAGYKIQTVKPGTSVTQSQVRTTNQSPAVITIAQPHMQSNVVRSQASVSSPALRPISSGVVPGNVPTVISRPITASTQESPAIRVAVSGIPAQGTVTPGARPGLQLNLPVEDNVKKCKNFLSTLIKLAANQPPNTVRNVRALIQGLIDGKIEAEDFTAKLQVELKSSPQPYLVPFLRRSLPLLRKSLTNNEMVIEGITPPPKELAAATFSTSSPISAATARPIRQPVASSSHSQPHVTPKLQKIGPATMRMPQLQGGKIPAHEMKVLLQKGQAGSQMAHAHISPKGKQSSPAASHREKRKYDALKEDDDINDVAAMGGVNLTEESRNIMATNSELMSTQLRSCKDESFLMAGPLASRINAIVKKHGLDDVSQEVANLVSHATQERLRNLAEKLAVIAEHRLEIYKTDSRYEVSSEVKGQIKFLEELDRLEKKRHEEQEREVLLRAVKSRSKNEDPEQLKLKQKAKEMQAAEMEEMRQRDANQTALLAIGPRKKKKTDTTDTSQSSGSGPSTPGTSGIGSSVNRSSMLRPRIKRVNLRDLLFLLEQEKESCKSRLLYQAFLK